MGDVPSVAGPAKSLAGFSANRGPDNGDAARKPLLALHAPNALPPAPWAAPVRHSSLGAQIEQASALVLRMRNIYDKVILVHK